MKHYFCSKCARTIRDTHVWFRCNHTAKNSGKHSEKINDWKDKKGNIKEGKVGKAAKLLGLNGWADERLREKFWSDKAFKNKASADDSGSAAELLNECYKKGYFLGKCTQSGVAESSNCPICDGHVEIHICPHCNTPLVIDSLHKDYVIDFAGTVSCGKTTFIGALLNDIFYVLNTIIGRNGWNATLLGDARGTRVDFKERLDEARTPEARAKQKPIDVQNTDVTARTEPISVQIKQINGNKYYTFIFYDVAGEVLNEKPDEIEDLARQFAYPDFIIMLTHPRQSVQFVLEVENNKDNQAIQKFISFSKNTAEENADPELEEQTDAVDGDFEDAFDTKDTDDANEEKTVKKAVSSRYVENYAETPSTDIVDNLVDLIKTAARGGVKDEGNDILDISGRLDIPMATCLSAVDGLFSYYEGCDKPYMRNSESLTKANNKWFDLEDVDRKSESVKEQLLEWQENGFVSHVEGNFGAPKTAKNSDYSKKKLAELAKIDRVKFFGTSSLGLPGENRGLNVLDVFLWILYLVGKEEGVEFFPTSNPDNGGNGND